MDYQKTTKTRWNQITEMKPQLLLLGPVAMFVSSLPYAEFVVWTKKGFSNHILKDHLFVKSYIYLWYIVP